jgi:hypothetical protein
MTVRNKILWLISFTAATALAISAEHAKTVAEMSHHEAGLYRVMPGIIVGLLVGFAVDSPIVVAVVTVAANAALYCWVLRLAVWVWRRSRHTDQA